MNKSNKPFMKVCIILHNMIIYDVCDANRVEELWISAWKHPYKSVPQAYRRI